MQGKRGQGKGARVKVQGESGCATRWEGFFRKDPRTIDAPPANFAEHAASFFRRKGARIVLDLGCGAGRDTMALAGNRFDVIGADLARSGLRIAKDRTSTKHIKGLVQADSRKLPFRDSSFEGIYCFGLLHEFTGRGAAVSVARTMSEARRVLKPGGLLALAVLAGDPKTGLPHVRLFTERMFDRAASGLAKIEKNDVTT